MEQQAGYEGNGGCAQQSSVHILILKCAKIHQACAKCGYPGGQYGIGAFHQAGDDAGSGKDDTKLALSLSEASRVYVFHQLKCSKLG